MYESFKCTVFIFDRTNSCEVPSIFSSSAIFLLACGLWCPNKSAFLRTCGKGAWTPKCAHHCLPRTNILSCWCLRLDPITKVSTRGHCAVGLAFYRSCHRTRTRRLEVFRKSWSLGKSHGCLQRWAQGACAHETTSASEPRGGGVFNPQSYIYIYTYMHV